MFSCIFFRAVVPLPPASRLEMSSRDFISICFYKNPHLFFFVLEVFLSEALLVFGYFLLSWGFCLLRWLSSKAAGIAFTITFAL